MGSSDQNWMEKLDREKSLFDEILALSERQLLLFTHKDENDNELTAKFNNLIDQRQMIIDTAVGLRDALLEEMGNDPVRVKQYEERQRKIQATVEKIGENDKEILRLARLVLQGFGDQLKAARQNKQAFQAYGGAAPNIATGWFIDRKK